MLISVRSLVDRLRHPRSRANELSRLRARFCAQPGSATATAGREQVALARELRALRSELGAAFGAVDACRGCASGRPPPAGRWTGGACCGTRTLDVFSPDEVAALKLGGTRDADLRAPRADHAGCAFRGPEGCSLPAVHRPNVCVRYICLELRAELHDRPDWRNLGKLARALQQTFERFVALRREAEVPWEQGPQDREYVHRTDAGA